jgi:hypothetical protein
MAAARTSEILARVERCAAARSYNARAVDCIVFHEVDRLTPVPSRAKRASSLRKKRIDYEFVATDVDAPGSQMSRLSR